MGAAAPRFRRDLSAAEVQADGVLYVEVSDTRSGKSFRFYDFEYAVALKLDGRPLAEVAREIRTELQLELTPEQLEAFGDQLRSLGFLDDDAAAFFPPLVDDESGEFEMPNLAAADPARTPPPAASPGPITPPPVRPEHTRTPGPVTPGPVVARSLTENTITSFPPEVNPGRGGASASPTPPATAPPPAQPLDLLGAGPFAPATTPRPELKPPAVDPTEQTQDLREDDLIAVAPAASNGHTASSRAEADAGEADEDRGEHDTRSDLPSIRDDLAAEPEDKTPTSDTRPLPTPPENRAVAEAPSIRERRELPTQRLRAVSADAADLPEPPPPSGKVDADADDDDDDELETAPSVSAPAPTAAMARLTSGGGLTPAATGGRQAWLAYAALGVAAAGIISVMVYKYLANPEPPAITVGAMVPSPTTVYRFWDQAAKVERIEAPGFSFSADGKVAEIASTGTRYGAGDVLGLLEGGKKFKADLAHNRERLGYYEQMRDTMTQQNNRPEIRQAELKIAEKKRLIAEAQASLSKQAIIAAAAGEVGEALVKVGDTVKAGDPALKAKGTGYRAVFELPKEEAEKARQLGFCRVEIDDKALECSLAAEGGDETHVVIDLPGDPVVGAGKSVRLARDRLDAVFSVPASALRRTGDSDRLYVVTPANRAELRMVAVAEREGQEAIITQGLDVGDRVIIDPPADLKPDARVLIRETVSK